ncbi:MAG TPA: MBL fold metallo-hydrolase [Bryobacteraceae bacterium]|jgi:ribonuclease Z|nr:MBL fold metallo-hydrolase [Bryobacteraceae bacterium]
MMLFAPASQTDRFGIFPGGSAGLSTMRGDMGALFLGMALFILTGAISGSTRWLSIPAILLSLVIFGRILSLIVDGRSSAQSLTVEILIAVVLLATIVSLPRAKARGSGFDLALGVAVLVAVIAGGAFQFQRQIGTMLFSRMINQGVDARLLDSLPDGLHAGLCGSGSPLPDATRSGPCVVVIAGKSVFIVDTGDGTARKLALMGIPPGRIDAILLTHFHSDHIAGLGDMLIQRWGGGSHKDQTPVIGPQGVETVVAGFNQAYSLDKGYRVAHHGEATMPPSGSGGVAHPFTLTQGSDEVQQVWQQGGLTITAFAVNHAPVFPAAAYRFDYFDRSLVISGDTSPSPVLAKYAKGVDALFHEGLQTTLLTVMHDATARTGRTSAAKITHDIPSYHTTPEDAARIAQEAGVKYLMFYHEIPPLPIAYMNAAFLGDAPKIFHGPISVGKDGMLLSMPVGGKTITLRELL